ncbi:MAG: sulfotransferase [Haliea sp.]|nr:sulfotransferase [Haliea sp.]
MLLKRLHQQAEQALSEGRPQEAHSLCLEVLRVQPRHSGAWFLCGVIAADNGRYEQALEIFVRACKLAPDNPAYSAEIGKTLIVLSRYGEALAAAECALALGPKLVTTWNTLGGVFSYAGEHKRALYCFRSAGTLLESGVGSGLSHIWKADLYFNLGTCSRFCGEFNAAEQALERAIQLQSTHFLAHATLAQLRHQCADNHHLARLEPLRGRVCSAEDQLSLGHAIAKEREDLGDYAAAFSALQWGKSRMRREQSHSVAADEALLESTRALFDQASFASAPPGVNSAEPIFIVGMPRTGTTLVEQILGGHSRVFAAGELPHFPLAVKRLGATPGSEVLNLDTLRAGLAVDPATLGRLYLESTRPRTGHRYHFIDKLPLNFIYLGLLRRALPRARFICLRRNPLDTCVSNYRQQFSSNFPYYRYALDLLDCGRYYLAFDRLIRHWQAVLPGGLLQVQYEQLVTEPEAQTQRLLAWCELPWEQSCLAFEQRREAVATASAVQVRRGIYRDSLQRWRQYADEVQPLRDLLQRAGVVDA